MYYGATVRRLDHYSSFSYIVPFRCLRYLISNRESESLNTIYLVILVHFQYRGSLQNLGSLWNGKFPMVPLFASLLRCRYNFAINGNPMRRYGQYLNETDNNCQGQSMKMDQNKETQFLRIASFRA